MKHIMTFTLLQALLLLSLPGQAAINIFACEPEWASLAEEIGRDRVAVFSATTGKQDPHHIQARPGLIAQARRADLLICTGADLEAGWVPLLLKKSANANILNGASGYFMTSDYVELLDKPQQLDRSQGDIHAAGNPHFHLDPRNMLRVAEALAARLSKIDKTNAGVYASNLADFSQRWLNAINTWQQQAQALKGTAYVVNHKSWIYLAHWLDVDMNNVIEPRPGIPPGAEHLSRLIDTIEQKGIKKILYAAHGNPRAAHWLAEKTGIRAIELPYTVGGNDRVNNLFELFDDTLKQLME